MGWSSVVSILMVVDLPAPFGPRKAKISPSATSNEIPSTAVTSPNVRLRLRTSMMLVMQESDSGGGRLRGCAIPTGRTQEQKARPASYSALSVTVRDPSPFLWTTSRCLLPLTLRVARPPAQWKLSEPSAPRGDVPVTVM